MLNRLTKLLQIRVKNISFYENFKMKGVLFMFIKTLTFCVEDTDLVKFCSLLGKYGLRFKIGNLSVTQVGDENNQSRTRRKFTVYAPRRKAYALYNELNNMRETVF